MTFIQALKLFFPKAAEETLYVWESRWAAVKKRKVVGTDSGRFIRTITDGSLSKSNFRRIREATVKDVKKEVRKATGG